MEEKEFQRRKKKIQKLFYKWVKNLGLGWYKIDISYKRGESTSDDDWNVVYMDTTCLWHYRTAEIRVWVEVLNWSDEWEVERSVVHELCHILTAPLKNKETDKEKLEYAVESIARSFLWVEEATKRKSLKK